MAEQKKKLKAEKMVVQKSNPLFSLWKSDLTLQEFKILDTYLARIDSHHPEKRRVIFEKGEFEKLLGVSKINAPQLKARLKSLMNNVLEVKNGDGTNNFHLISLFEEAATIQDESSGQWTVILECTQPAMKYFFNVEKLGYFRYTLRSVINLQSRYSYILFLYCESKRNLHTWTISVDELKLLLSCDKDEAYKNFKYFNNLILRKCQKEIVEKTECRFTYETIRTGKKVTDIRFTIEPLKILLTEETSDLTEACNKEFTSQQIHALCKVLEAKGYQMESVEGLAVMYRCLKETYIQFLAVAEQGNINNRFAYFKAMLQKDVPDRKEAEHNSHFKWTNAHYVNQRDEEYNEKDLFENLEE